MNQSNIKTQTLKGFRDFLPSDMYIRNYVKNTLTELFETSGFQPLETPALEYSSVLKGKYGSEPVSDKPKSFFGIINQIDDQQILITSQNKNLTLQLNDKITYIDIKRQKSKLTNFKVGQTILAMGYLNQDGILDCRRLIATDSKSVENSYQVITGKIVDVSQSQSSPIFVLIPFQNKNGQYQIKIDSKTEISDINQKEINSSDIIVNGKKIIVVIKSETQNSQTFYASRIISLETNSQLSDSTLKQP